MDSIGRILNPTGITSKTHYKMNLFILFFLTETITISVMVSNGFPCFFSAESELGHPRFYKASTISYISGNSPSVELIDK